MLKTIYYLTILNHFNGVQVVYRYEKICYVCLDCGLLGHEYQTCEEKLNDEASRNYNDSKFDSWMLVHGVRRTQGRHREFKCEPMFVREEEEGLGKHGEVEIRSGEFGKKTSSKGDKEVHGGGGIRLGSQD
ncbi:hypothetical protein LIER_28423 [Lithospermum erythrorhizon]|uniref:CCHC-type domain-containing protein n=1 Tax=Lithospermum erythrorhizon TaxID=34254 RepID=A0AAV3RHI9_LITER